MYQHKVQYYETDKMGITHHSNYIRWMEEARVDYLTKLGYGFEKLEENGVVSPVVDVEGKYKKSTIFPEIIDITVKVEEYNGIKLKLFYEMKNARGEVVFEGRSVHGFLDEKNRLVRLDKTAPEFHEILTNQLIKDNKF